MLKAISSLWNKTSINETVITNSTVTCPDVINTVNIVHTNIPARVVKRRKGKKFLSTCSLCGHYRFAKKKGKEIVNFNYRYEHSNLGGCPVPIQKWTPRAARFHRYCPCEVCKKASSHFMPNTLDLTLKRNYYNYERSADEELLWQRMKLKGWKCYKGQYFPPQMKRNVRGLNHDDAFALMKIS